MHALRKSLLAATTKRASFVTGTQFARCMSTGTFKFGQQMITCFNDFSVVMLCLSTLAKHI